MISLLVPTLFGKRGSFLPFPLTVGVLFPSQLHYRVVTFGDSWSYIAESIKGHLQTEVQKFIRPMMTKLK